MLSCVNKLASQKAGTLNLEPSRHWDLRVISVDHEPQRGENHQCEEKPAETTGEVGSSFDGNTEDVTKTEISR